MICIYALRFFLLVLVEIGVYPSVDRIYSVDILKITLITEFSEFGVPNKRVLITVKYGFLY